MQVGSISIKKDCSFSLVWWDLPHVLPTTHTCHFGDSCLSVAPGSSSACQRNRESDWSSPFLQSLQSNNRLHALHKWLKFTLGAYGIVDPFNFRGMLICLSFYILSTYTSIDIISSLPVVLLLYPFLQQTLKLQLLPSSAEFKSMAYDICIHTSYCFPLLFKCLVFVILCMHVFLWTCQRCECRTPQCSTTIKKDLKWDVAVCTLTLS